MKRDYRKVRIPRDKDELNNLLNAIYLEGMMDGCKEFKRGTREIVKDIYTSNIMKQLDDLESDILGKDIEDRIYQFKSGSGTSDYNLVGAASFISDACKCHKTCNGCPFSVKTDSKCWCRLNTDLPSDWRFNG